MKLEEITSRIDLIQNKLITLSEITQSDGIVNLQNDLLRQLNDLQFHRDMIALNNSNIGEDDGAVICTEK